MLVCPLRDDTSKLEYFCFSLLPLTVTTMVVEGDDGIGGKGACVIEVERSLERSKDSEDRFKALCSKFERPFVRLLLSSTCVSENPALYALSTD